MNRSVRSTTVISFAVLAVAVSGCESDVRPVDVSDALAEDSTLALEVFGATPDSTPSGGDTSISATDTLVIGDAAPVAPPIVRSLPRPPVQVASRTPSRVAASSAVVGSVRRSESRSSKVRDVSTSTSRRTSAVARTPVARTPVTRTPDRDLRVVASRAWLTLPAGVDLQFESDRQICSNATDGVFEATLTKDVVAANGVIVPDGATARGEVFSTPGKPDLRIQWITFNGRMYAVDTRVTHTDMKRVRSKSRGSSAAKIAGGAGAGAITGGILGRDAKGALIGAATGAVAGAIVANRTASSYMSCVPDGGRIVAELTEPLRILMSE